MEKKELNEFTKLKNVSSKFAKENCFNLLMKIIPGLLENDFNTFANGIQKIQENMSEIFYGNKNNFSNHSISKIFKFVREKSILGLDNPHGDQLDLFFVKIKKKEKKFLI